MYNSSINISLKMFRGLLIVCFMFIAFNSMAQKERKEIRSGNSKYENGKYADAETEYRKALEKNRNSMPGTYNLGGALYRQKKYDEAIQQYQEAVSKAADNTEKSETLHNLGNALVQAQKYEESINAYKQALKLNPEDNDTRYNLAYAQSMLRQQQQQQQQQEGDDKKDQNQQQDKNKENQSDQNKDQQQDKNQKENNKQGEQKDQARQQPKISKEDAERILKALQNDEKNLQEKMQMKSGQKVRVEKDW